MLAASGTCAYRVRVRQYYETCNLEVVLPEPPVVHVANLAAPLTHFTPLRIDPHKSYVDPKAIPNQYLSEFEVRLKKCKEHGLIEQRLQSL